MYSVRTTQKKEKSFTNRCISNIGITLYMDEGPTSHIDGPPDRN